MKSNIRLLLKTFVICSMCFVLFFGFGYFYLSRNLTPASQKSENVPYSQTVPNNTGVLFTVNGRNTFIFFDFYDSKITISLNPEESFKNQIYGYSHNFSVDGNSDLISTIIDSVGGIELELKDEKLRFTGIQVAETLKRSNSIELRRNIITALCDKISKYGVTSSFFAEIINNSQTNLTLAECFFWNEYLKELCCNIHFID